MVNVPWKRKFKFYQRDTALAPHNFPVKRVELPTADVAAMYELREALVLILTTSKDRTNSKFRRSQSVNSTTESLRQND